MTAKRALMMLCHAGLRGFAWITGARSRPVHAMVITPQGRIVLVRHSYVRGWHFPGGALKRHETPEAGIVRELREEIGLLRWGLVSRLNLASSVPGRPARPFFVFTDAEYRFRPNLEIDRVAEIDPDDPMRPSQRALVDHWRALQGGQPSCA